MTVKTPGWLLTACAYLFSLALLQVSTANDASNKNEWDFMVFTQSWPPTSCLDIDIKHMQCVMPPSVGTWAIHGIWPSRNVGPIGPFQCDKDDKFVEAKIMEIEPSLVEYWPNLIASEAKTSFWKHEWEKHGTCAKSLEAMGSELLYFEKGLELNARFNLLQILNKGSISPSNSTSYKLPDIRKVIEAGTNSSIKMQCIFSKDKSEQALIQVEICLDKNFDTIDCAAEKLRFIPESKMIKKDDISDIPYNPAYQTCTDDRPTFYYAFPK